MRALLVILILASQPCFSAEINPYLDPSLQDYVETSFGYMTERGNFVQDLRDALGPIAELKSPVRYQPAEKIRTHPVSQAALPRDNAGGEALAAHCAPALKDESASPPVFSTGDPSFRARSDASIGKAPRKSGMGHFSQSKKKELLARLNSFSTEEVKTRRFKSGGENNPDEPDYRVRSAGSAGSLASAVPPVGSADRGYLYTENPAPGFNTEIYLSLKIPAGAQLREFLSMVLRKMNKEAGFVWKRTVYLSVSRLADSGPVSVPALTVTVFGNVPADGVRKLFECPFVTSIE